MRREGGERRRRELGTEERQVKEEGGEGEDGRRVVLAFLEEVRVVEDRPQSELVDKEESQVTSFVVLFLLLLLLFPLSFVARVFFWFQFCVH